MFEKFPSLTRFSHGWTITEKLDGSNACVLIVPEHEWSFNDNPHENTERVLPSFTIEEVLHDGTAYAVLAQSRSKLITPGKGTDNHGFASFVKDNATELVAKLGEGRHFGEWVGKGINKRHYDLPEKRFALFNSYRWTGADLPDRVTVVPVLAEGYMDSPGAAAAGALAMMKINGSVFAPGFMNPEGVVMYHGPSKTTFKKTYDYDEQGKWAENQAAKSTS